MRLEHEQARKTAHPVDVSEARCFSRRQLESVPFANVGTRPKLETQGPSTTQIRLLGRQICFARDDNQKLNP